MLISRPDVDTLPFIGNAQNKKYVGNQRYFKSDSDNGIVTLLKPGAVSIIATSDDNPNVTAICNIDIQVPISIGL